MFEIKQESENVFTITCDGFDNRLFKATIAEGNKTLVEFCLSIVKAAVKGAKIMLYPDS